MGSCEAVAFRVFSHTVHRRYRTEGGAPKTSGRHVPHFETPELRLVREARCRGQLPTMAQLKSVLEFSDDSKLSQCVEVILPSYGTNALWYAIGFGLRGTSRMQPAVPSSSPRTHCRSAAHLIRWAGNCTFSSLCPVHTRLEISGWNFAGVANHHRKASKVPNDGVHHGAT